MRALLDEGIAVRAAVAPGDPARTLAGANVERVAGDLRDPSWMSAALAGCDALFHLAADYRLSYRDAARMHAINVGGTRHVMEAALAAGTPRVVHTSSVGVLGQRADGAPADEDMVATLDSLCGPYKKTKWLADVEVERLRARGLPAVTVLPSTPIGPLDARPTPTGGMIVDFLRGRMVGYVATAMNFVHVRDVARGHLLAARRGKPGRRYILGGENLALRDFFRLLGRVSGRDGARLRVPWALAWCVGAASEAWGTIARREPAVGLASVQMARRTMTFSAARAVRELGLPQTPVETAARDAVEWFRREGYA